MSQSLIRSSEFQRHTGYIKAFVYRILKESHFPQSIRIGTRAIVESEVDEWINQRITESRGEVVL